MALGCAPVLPWAMILKRLLLQSRNLAPRADIKIRKKIWSLIAFLVLLVLAHSMAMVKLEGMSFWQGLWLTLTTLTTVGYSDLSARTQPGQLATILLMYVSAITLVTFIISDYIDYRIARHERIRTGFWDWKMENHILIINSPKHNALSFFNRLVVQIREDKDYSDSQILLLNNEFTSGLPANLKDLGVRHISGSGNNDPDLERAKVSSARHILVLARDEYDANSDSITFDISDRLKRLSLVHKTLVECVEDVNRPRICDLGVKSILRPIRSYPEILVRAMDAPGSEVVIEDMFTRRDDHPERYRIWLEGERWADGVNAMEQSKVGTPLAFMDKEGKVFVHPTGDEHITAQSLIILVKSDQVPNQDDVDRAFKQFFNKALVD